MGIYFPTLNDSTIMATLTRLVLCAIVLGQSHAWYYRSNPSEEAAQVMKREKQGASKHFDEVNFSNINCVDGACYIFVSKPETFHAAGAVCSRYGGFLAEVKTEAQSNEIERVRKTIPKDFRGVWIGGHDLAAEGEWVWQHSNDEIPMSGEKGFQKWAKGEPNDNGKDGEQCLAHEALSGAGYWNDLPCSTKQPFVYQKKLKE